MEEPLRIQEEFESDSSSETDFFVPVQIAVDSSDSDTDLNSEDNFFIPKQLKFSTDGFYNDGLPVAATTFPKGNRPTKIQNAEKIPIPSADNIIDDNIIIVEDNIDDSEDVKDNRSNEDSETSSEVSTICENKTISNMNNNAPNNVAVNDIKKEKGKNKRKKVKKSSSKRKVSSIRKPESDEDEKFLNSMLLETEAKYGKREVVCEKWIKPTKKKSPSKLLSSLADKKREKERGNERNTKLNETSQLEADLQMYHREREWMRNKTDINREEFAKNCPNIYKLVEQRVKNKPKVKGFDLDNINSSNGRNSNNNNNSIEDNVALGIDIVRKEINETNKKLAKHKNVDPRSEYQKMIDCNNRIEAIREYTERENEYLNNKRKNTNNINGKSKYDDVAEIPSDEECEEIKLVDLYLGKKASDGILKMIRNRNISNQNNKNSDGINGGINRTDIESMKDEFGKAIDVLLEEAESKQVIREVSNTNDKEDGKETELDNDKPAKLDDRFSAPLLEYIRDEMIEYSINSPMAIDTMRAILDYENGKDPLAKYDKNNTRIVNKKTWDGMCTLMYANFKDKMIPLESTKLLSASNTVITNARYFYIEILKQYISQGTINLITEMDSRKVFERYNPETTPIAIGCFQKDVTDLFPTCELILSMENLAKAKLVPVNYHEFNPFGLPVVAYCVFWSYSINFNLFGAFYRCPLITDEQGNIVNTDVSYKYYWIVYDRLQGISKISFQLPQ